MLKKFLKGLGITVLVIAIIFAGIFVWVSIISSKYNETAIPYIEKVMPELSKWDVDVAKQYMAPEALDSVSDADFAKLMKFLSKIGSLKSIEEPQFQNASSSATTGTGTLTTVLYTFTAHYENGDATITLKLKPVENGYQVYHFNVNSMALAE